MDTTTNKYADWTNDELLENIAALRLVNAFGAEYLNETLKGYPKITQERLDALRPQRLQKIVDMHVECTRRGVEVLPL